MIHQLRSGDDVYDLDDEISEIEARRIAPGLWIPPACFKNETRTVYKGFIIVRHTAKGPLTGDTLRRTVVYAMVSYKENGKTVSWNKVVKGSFGGVPLKKIKWMIDLILSTKNLDFFVL